MLKKNEFDFMEIIKIKEKKLAIQILLKSVKDMFEFDLPLDPLKDPDLLPQPNICRYVDLDGSNYEIDSNVFEGALRYLVLNGFVKIIKKLDINTSCYWISLGNYGKILNKISYLESQGISLDKIEKSNEQRQSKESNLSKTTKKLNINSIVPIKLRLKWENITLRFINNFDVDIFIKGKFFGKYSHEKLHFYKINTKDKKIDTQWKFLEKISVTKGKFDLNKDIIFLNKNIQEKFIEKERFKKIISKLSLHLQALFNIEEDAFVCYREKYESKFKLEPTSLLRGSGEIFIPDHKIKEEISEYHKNQIENRQTGLEHRKNRKNDF